ncbi:MAG: hypothetical protein WD669_09205 [Pirellulales bacterium]
MSQLYISRSLVRNKLMWAATARTWITVASALAVVALIWLTFPAAKENWWVAAAALIGVPILVWWIVTNLLCRPLVECPACKGCLWDIGTGKFQPRGMKIKDDVTSCPHCGAVMI